MGDEFGEGKVRWTFTPVDPPPPKKKKLFSEVRGEVEGQEVEVPGSLVAPKDIELTLEGMLAGTGLHFDSDEGAWEMDWFDEEGE